MLQTTSSTFSPLPLPQPHLYILYPSPSLLSPYRPTHSILPPSIINLSILTLSSATYSHHKSQNGQCPPPPYFHIPYTPYLLFSLHATFPPQFPILLSHLSTWSSSSYASYNLSTHIEPYIHFPSASQSSLISTSPLLPLSNLLLLSATLCPSTAAPLPLTPVHPMPPHPILSIHTSPNSGANLSPTSPYFLPSSKASSITNLSSSIFITFKSQSPS